MDRSITPIPLKNVEVRFETITSPCEWVEDYRTGGYHPVHLGDTFKDGQYKVIRKLGEGAYSTVWLASDTKNTRYIALKILASELVEPIQELQILHNIARLGPSEGAQYLTELLDEFKHNGPNGTHTCLVFEPLGPSVNSMVEELPQFKPRIWGMKIRYSYWMAKSILKQSLQALAFLHSKGIAHGDFQPGNMLFDLNDSSFEYQPEDTLRQQTDVEAESISPAVQRLDGKLDHQAPRYLCVAQPLVSFTNLIEGFKIKISDMGGAYFFTDPPIKLVTPLGLRAPEFVLTGAIGKSLDVWAFGCLVFELITGEPLCCVPSSQFEDDDHLLSLTARLGALSNELFQYWQTSSLYFTADRELFNCQLGGVPEGEEPLMIKSKTMEESFDEAETGLSEMEARNAKALIRRVLKYNPMERPSPEELLNDGFFR